MTVQAERAARHGFVDRPCTTVVAAAAHTVAIQAQDLAQARLGVRPRSSGLTEDDVTAAIADRTVVRTWLMRNTIHLVAADDLRWLVELFGPMIRRRFAKRWDGLGLSAEVLARAEALAPQALAGRQLTRHDFVAALAERGVSLSEDPAARTHLMVYLATIGLTCHADHDRFALVDDWLPSAAAGPRGDDAVAELARRWFAAFSPATAADFTAWSGLPSTHAMKLIREELTEVDIGGRRGFRLGEPTEGSSLRLLSAFDNFLIGYRERGELIAEGRRAEVYVGGIIRPVVLRDGVVVGRWRLDRSSSRVEVRHFVTPCRAVRSALDGEVADLARFVGADLDLHDLSDDM